MRITYLGTAAAEGIPAVWCDCEICRKVRKSGGKDVRTRSQVLINDDFLVDFPQDTYMHMLRHGLFAGRIRYVIFTHSHQDHFYPDEFNMRSSGYAHDLPFPVRVYGNDVVVRQLKQVPEIEIPDRVELTEFRNFVPVRFGDYTVIPMTANHDPRENCLIFSISCGGKTMFYGNDTGEYPEETWEYIEKNRLHFDLLSMDCTMGLKDCRNYHLGYPNILRMTDRFREIGAIGDHTKIIATHYSHNHYILHNEMEKSMAADHIVPAYDGMTLEI